MAINHSLLLMALEELGRDSGTEKFAVVPGGQTDPMAGGGMAPPAPAAPPPADPMAGGGAPAVDPAIQQQVQMAMQQAGGGMAGGPAGKGGGKKAEQQLLDTKLWIIQYILVQLAEQAGLKLPPSVLIGPPPDPMAMAQAQTEAQTPMAPGAPAQQGDPMAAAGGAGGAGGGAFPPIQPMQPGAGPAPKTAASLLDDGGIRIGAPSQLLVAGEVAKAAQVYEPAPVNQVAKVRRLLAGF